MKRFYDRSDAVKCPEGYCVNLDDKPVHTPGNRLLVVPNRAVAEVVAEEWRGQAEVLDRELMPITRLVCAALDLIPLQRSGLIKDLVRYAETDLVCYRAERPPGLVQRQTDAWDPLVTWIARHYGAHLLVTKNVMPVAQERSSLDTLRAVVSRHSDLTLSGLNFATKAFGSLIIGLAMLEGRLDALAAAESSLVDERFQLARWGKDEELIARCSRVNKDAVDADRLIRLLER